MMLQFSRLQVCVLTNDDEVVGCIFWSYHSSQSQVSFEIKFFSELPAESVQIIKSLIGESASY